MKNPIFNLIMVILFVFWGGKAYGDVVSFFFADNIKSSGIGNINLLKAADSRKDITPALLEAFRQDGGGDLIFAVDVNEAASGSEKADSQGVAIESLTLRISNGTETYEYTSYTTNTESILQPVGGARSVYSTLIGTAGTDRFSSNQESELNSSSLDATLRIPVDKDLSLMSEMSLSIKFLDTDVALGDPEAFYDYSNGFESIALVSNADATYLDTLMAGQDSAPLVISTNEVAPTYSWSYYPSSQSYYVVAYEDLFPLRGDYDFNDLVVAYQVAIGTDSNAAVKIVKGNGFLVARGGVYDHDWRLRIALPANATGVASVNFFPADSEVPFAGFPKEFSVTGDIDLVLAESVDDYFFDGVVPYVNTMAEQAVLKGPRFEFMVTLDSPVAQNKVEPAPFDPYLYVHDTGHEIHLVNKKPVLPYSNTTLNGMNQFRDENGFPFALLVPENWEPPLADVDIGVAYPNFIEFIETLGGSAHNWYASPASGKVKKLNFIDW